jgi:hypothetical protein
MKRLLTSLIIAGSIAYSQEPGGEIRQMIQEYSQFANLSLEDLSFGVGSNQWMTISATTSAFNATAQLFVASFPTTGPRAGHMVAIKPQHFSLSDYFQGAGIPALSNLSFNNVALILSDGALAAPAEALPDDAYSFFSEALGADDFYLNLRPGLNIMALVSSEQLSPEGPLRNLMDKLGVGGGTIFLQGAIGRRIQDLYLMAIFPPMSPQGSPEWFNSGQLAIELTGQPSVGLVGGISVDINGEQREFFVKTKVGRDGLILVGGMIADSGWVSPFGIQGLTLNKVVLLLGITPSGSVQLGFEGDLVVGEKDMHTAVLVALSPAGVPTNFMFDGESAAGFGVSDLVTLQQKIAAARSASSPAIPLDNVPPLYIKDAKLKFAPKDSPDLGISRGMTVAGLLQLKPEPGSTTKDLANAHFEVGDEGIIARGNVGAFTLGPVNLQEASLDLTLTRSEQYCILTGQADLGFMNAGIDMNITKTSATFNAETRIFNAFQAELSAKGVLNLTQPAFNVHAKMKNDFNSATAQQLRQAIKDIVTNKKNTAKAAADEAERKWQNAVSTRESARERWANLPLLPRDPKVAARNAWEAAVAKATRLRVEKESKEGKERQWTLAGNLLAQFEQQAGSGGFVVVRRAEFEADLANLKTGAVKMMAIDASVGNREYDLQLSSWNFKNMGTSVKAAAQNIADRLFDSFQ